MISVSSANRLTTITLDRPDKRNALNVELCGALAGAVRAAVAEDARALVLTGTGSSFCSGADLDAVYDQGFREALYDMLSTVTEAPLPVIAAVNGPAIGAGTQLAIAADLRVVAPTATFAVPTARLGLAVDPWTIRRLGLLAGNGVARQLLLACERLSAEQALACGLADRAGSLADASAWAAELVDLAPLTVAYNKLVLNHVFEPNFGPLVDKELFAAFEGCWSSEDLREGQRARAERRPPRFQGR
jgi:enoyl-CoA hydratase